MARLPIVGSDDGTWGEILNEFLEVSLNNSSEPTGGTLKSSAVDDAGAVMNTDTTTSSMQFVVDEDDMSSNSATKVPTQQSVKAYVDSAISGTVKLTGDQTVAGIKTHTSQVRGAYDDDGKVIISGTGVGGSVAVYKDESDSDSNPSVALAAGVGLAMGSGSSAPDTTISRAGANNLSFNNARLSSVANPTSAQDAATKNYVDATTVAQTQGGVAYRVNGLEDWFEALATATADEPIDVVCITDSLGDVGTNYAPGWPQLVERMLNLQLGASAPTPWAVHASGNQSASAISVAIRASTSLAGQGATLNNGGVLTHTETCTGFMVAYRSEPGFGTMTIRDGEGGTILDTINCNASAKSGNIWTSGTLSNEEHTLHITSSGTTCPEIIRPITTDHKVRVWPVGHTGYTSSEFASNNYLALDLIDTLDAAGTLKLVIIATGANDDASYETDFPALVSEVQTHTSENIALWLPYVSGLFSQSEYDVAKPLIHSLGLPVIDASTVVTATAAGPDGTNPTVAQRDILATHITSVISGDPIGTAIKRAADPSLSWAITSGFNPYPELAPFDAEASAIIGAPGAGIAFGDGTSRLGDDTTLARSAPRQLSINNSTGTLQANIAPEISLKYIAPFELETDDAGKQVYLFADSLTTLTLPHYDDAAIAAGTMIPIINLGEVPIEFVEGDNAEIWNNDTPTIGPGQHATAIKLELHAWLVLINGGGSGSSTVRTESITSSDAPSINTDGVDYFEITALAEDISTMSTNLTGTPTVGQKLWISITGTAIWSIDWGNSFEEGNYVWLPSETEGTDRLDVGFIWNDATGKWRCVGVA